jgi:hypothetical protein
MCLPPTKFDQEKVHSEAEEGVMHYRGKEPSSLGERATEVEGRATKVERKVLLATERRSHPQQEIELGQRRSQSVLMEVGKERSAGYLRKEGARFIEKGTTVERKEQ